MAWWRRATPIFLFASSSPLLPLLTQHPSAILVPLQAVTPHLRHLDPGGGRALFARPNGPPPQTVSVGPYLRAGDMRAVAFQRGFADWIGESSSKLGIKAPELFRCHDRSQRLGFLFHGKRPMATNTVTVADASVSEAAARDKTHFMRL